MSHELKRVWNKGTHQASLYCEDCQTVYPYRWIDYVEGKEVCPHISGIKCNQCKNDMMSEMGHSVYGLEARVSAGYESITLHDCTEYRFRLCEECLAKVFEQFEIPVQVREYLGGDVVEARWHDGKKGKDWQ